MELAVQPPKPISVLKAEMAEKTGPAREMAASWKRSHPFVSTGAGAGFGAGRSAAAIAAFAPIIASAAVSRAGREGATSAWNEPTGTPSARRNVAHWRSRFCR